MLKAIAKKSLPRIELRGRLIGIREFIFASSILALLFGSSIAQNPQFKFIRLSKSDIQVEIVISDSLPQELLSYIDKGVPVSFDYKFELWHENPGWFDQLASENFLSAKVRYDSWEKRYSVVQTSKNLTVENELTGQREAVELLCDTGPIALSSKDTSGVFYIYGYLTIKTMSFSNYKEVESWLKGGVSDVKTPQLQDAPDKVGEFVFNMAMKMSGLKNISREISSGRFRLGDLPLLTTGKNR
jgi:hypothetical protein